MKASSTLLLLLWLAWSSVSQRASIRRKLGRSKGASLSDDNDDEEKHSRRKRKIISSVHAPQRNQNEDGRVVCKRKSDCQPVPPPPPASVPAPRPPHASGPAPPRAFKWLSLSWYFGQSNPPPSVTPPKQQLPSQTRSPDTSAPTPNSTRNLTLSPVPDFDSPALPPTLSPAVASPFAPPSLLPQPFVPPTTSPVIVPPSLKVNSPRPTLAEPPIGTLTPVEMGDSPVALSSETIFPSVDASPTGALTLSETSSPTITGSPAASPTGESGDSPKVPSLTSSPETSFPTDISSPMESPTGELEGSLGELSVTPSWETSFPTDKSLPVESPAGESGGSTEAPSLSPSPETSFPSDISSPVESPTGELGGSLGESSVTPSWETSFPTDKSSPVESPIDEAEGYREESSVTPSSETSFPSDISSPVESPIDEAEGYREDSSVTPSSETSFPSDISSPVDSPTGELGDSLVASSVTPSWETGSPTFLPSSEKDVPIPSPAKSVPCNKVNIDFNRLANGTQLQGGRYISTEYLRDYGVKLVASGGFNNLPRLFDTSVVGNIASLGSPNQECSPSGPGEGESGSPGEPGENCEPQGNILIIQNKNDDDELPDPNDVGGVISIELSSRVIFTFGIRLMNIAGNETTVKIAYVNAAGTKIPKTIAVEGLGENSIETVPIFKTGVFSIAVNLSGPGAITEIGLCVSPGEEERL